MLCPRKMKSLHIIQRHPQKVEFKNVQNYTEKQKSLEAWARPRGLNEVCSL